MLLSKFCYEVVYKFATKSVEEVFYGAIPFYFGGYIGDSVILLGVMVRFCCEVKVGFGSFCWKNWLGLLEIENRELNAIISFLIVTSFFQLDGLC